MTNIDEMEIISKNGLVKVSWVNLGEGFSGEYDSSDPDDVNLLRFDVYRKEADVWIPVDDASYCTRTPADTPDAILMKLLEHIIAEVEDPVTDGSSIKKLCERLSWIDPSWVIKELDSESMESTSAEKAVKETRKITVKKVGGEPGFCAEYFVSEKGDRYVKVTHPVDKQDIEWYTALSYSWEADIPLKGKAIEFVEAASV